MAGRRASPLERYGYRPEEPERQRLFVKPHYKYGDGGGEYIRDRLGTDITGYSAEEESV
ncbi:MAG: hypothetical protein ACLUOI_35500 [Eisenbergiella sp.]